MSLGLSVRNYNVLLKADIVTHDQFMALDKQTYLSLPNSLKKHGWAEIEELQMSEIGGSKMTRAEEDFLKIKKYSIDLSLQGELAIRMASAYTGKLCMGVVEKLGNIHFFATLDDDGHLELSLSYNDRKPNDADVRIAFLMFGLMPAIFEDSKKIGVIRHFIVHQGNGRGFGK